MYGLDIVVLDIRSSRITVFVGNKSKNNNIVYNNLYQIKYDGYTSSGFTNKESLITAVDSAINYIKSNLTISIDKIYVGLGGAFVTIKNENLTLDFPKKTRITKKHIEKLIEMGRNLEIDDHLELISTNATYFTIEGNRKVFSPIKNTSKFLKCNISNIYCQLLLQDFLLEVLAGYDINNVVFIYSGLSQSLTLLDDDDRKFCCLLLDSGYLSTTINHIKGDGITKLKTIDYGDGLLNVLLADYLNISFKLAESLTKQISLTKTLDNCNQFIVKNNDESLNFDRQKVNQFVFSYIDKLISNINDFIASTDLTLRENIKIYVSGGGVFEIEGVYDYICSKVSYEILPIKETKSINTDRKMLSAYSLLDYAIKTESKIKTRKKFLFF